MSDTKSASVHVMLDIETWSTKSNAMVISIGAVKFLKETFEIVDKFYVGIDPKNASLYGSHIDADTVLWWMQPEQAPARKRFLEEPTHDVGTALEGFQMWMTSIPDLTYPEAPDIYWKDSPVWGNGVGFDNVILRNFHDAAGVNAPWLHWDDRCYRTMKNLDGAPARPEWPDDLTKHHPTDDAEYQVRHLKEIVGALGSSWI